MKNEYIKINISNEEFNSKIPAMRGVYKIYTLDEYNVPIPICRILDIDKNGLLYIGCTPKRNLQERLADLRKALLPSYKSNDHIFAWKYKVNEKIMKTFPVSSLAITCSSSERPKDDERKLLNEYKENFGELPPFNSN